MCFAVAITKAEVENHLNMAKTFLAKGQLADALSHYHAAIGNSPKIHIFLTGLDRSSRLLDGDPDNYMAYFRRATVYLALGRAKSALHDMERVIELKPDFILVRNLFWSSASPVGCER